MDKVIFNFSKSSPKTIGGEKTGKVGRPKGCKLVNKVNRNSESQKRFGHRSKTTSQNKFKDTPIKHGYHLEDYNRQVAYLHYYNNEEKPFYVGTGTLQRAFVIGGSRRHEEYNKKVQDINLVKVKIIAIDITEEEGILIEKEYCNKYGTIENGGCLVNIILGGRGGKVSNKTSHRPICRIDKFGQIVEKFGSAREAANKLNLDASQITKVCKGKAKTSGGMRFIYDPEYI